MASQRVSCSGTQAQAKLDRQQANLPELAPWDIVLSAVVENEVARKKDVDLRSVASQNSDDAAQIGTNRILGVLIGKLVGRDQHDQPVVIFAGSPGRPELPARTTVPWTDADLGKEAVLMFECGDPGKPIIMGFLHESRPDPISIVDPIHLCVDGEQVVLTAEKEIVLRCGKASMTLTHAGKVLLQGTYVSSHSTGVNRIKGGSVQIN